LWPHNGHSTSCYIYKEITYVVDDYTGEEVTSYAQPLKLDLVQLDRSYLLSHDEYAKKVKSDLTCWTSHTVVVVDTSGSMKESDVWGSRNRLGAVWISRAPAFVGHSLESGESSLTDILTIVTLSEDPVVILK
jgi:hypothetical protein